MRSEVAQSENQVGYVLERYDEAIEYYWKASGKNKRAYKVSRYLSVILGATVTLLASLMSADFVSESANLSLNLAIVTPVLAALLTIVGGFAQNFNWGSAWREMVLTAGRLEKERDRIRVSGTEEYAESDLDLLNELVLTETRSFFERCLGASKPG